MVEQRKLIGHSEFYSQEEMRSLLDEFLVILTLFNNSLRPSRCSRTLISFASDPISWCLLLQEQETVLATVSYPMTWIVEFLC